MTGILAGRSEHLSVGGLSIVIKSKRIYKLFQTILRIQVLIVAFALTLGECLPASASEPTPYRAVYKARFKGFPIGATGIRELRKLDDNKYILTSTASNFLGKIAEASTFEVLNGDIAPQRYEYHRTGIGRHRSTVVTFDWNTMQASNDVESRKSELPIPSGTQDKLSYQFKLRDDLTDAYARGENWPELSYKIDDDGELKDYSFKVVGEEMVDTPIGRFKTIKTTRTDGNPNRTTNFWLAPAYDFMLIRFEQTEPNGGGFELTLRQAVFDGKKITARQ